MYKEIIISIFIISLIFIGDYITQKYTKNSVNDLNNELNNLKQSLILKDEVQAKTHIEALNKKWEEFHNKLAYYIEHDELEKAETDIIACKSLTETENYELAIGEVDKTVFILQHITDKYSFNLENIFKNFVKKYLLLYNICIK